MRLSGVLDGGNALADTDHVCWVHDDPAPFADAAQRSLAGLARTWSLPELAGRATVTSAEAP